MYETEEIHIKDLTGECSDEYWTIASPSGELWIDEDRADTWASYAENYAPDRFGLWWPSRVRDAIVRTCVETETQAMNTALAQMAHTERSPRWFPAISKIAIPPEDTRPYPLAAFAQAKQHASKQTADNLHKIELACVETHLNHVINRAHEAGWLVAIVSDAPRLAIELYPRDEPPVLALLTGNDHPIINRHQLALYDRDITTEDLKFLAAVEHVVKKNLGAGLVTSPLTHVHLAELASRHSLHQPELPEMPAPPRPSLFAVASPFEVDGGPVDLGAYVSTEPVPARAPQM